MIRMGNFNDKASTIDLYNDNINLSLVSYFESIKFKQLGHKKLNFF